MIRRLTNDDAELGILVERYFKRSGATKDIRLDEFVKAFGAFIDEKMVGFILFNDVYGDIEICYIAVIEEYRRRHIASKLISEVLKLMKNMCSLDVRSKNIAAIALYKSLGFVPVYIRKNYYDDDDAIVMLKEVQKC